MVRPWNEEYDEIIMWHLLREQRKKKLITENGIPVDFKPVTRSYSELYKLVMKERKDSRKKGTLSHETFLNHLNILVQSRFLTTYPKKGRRIVYGLDKETYLKMRSKRLNVSPEELDRRLLK